MITLRFSANISSHRNIDRLCLRFLRSPPPLSRRSTRRLFSESLGVRIAVSESSAAQRLGTKYFLSNAFIDSGRIGTRETATTSTSDGLRETSANDRINQPIDARPDLPHRRRRRRNETIVSADSASQRESIERPLPLDASATLSSHAAKLPLHSLRRHLSVLLSLAKPRLSFLILLTTTSAYSIYPVPALLNPSFTDTPSLSALTLLFLTSGTALTCASANALNMLYEPKWDALMSRTRNRPLVRGLISTRAALLFAVATGVTGVAALYFGVNPTVAFLGGLNICLYATVYTPLKRVSSINTWVGAIVGGIPPLMGWAAAAGQNATGTGSWRDLLFSESSIGGWLLAGLLFAWQFPHFMALSWPIREEYRNAGYKMLCWTNPARNGRVALRYSLLLLPICVGLSVAGVTDWAFAVTSAPVNAWLIREAWRFHKYGGLKGSARGLFWASVWHLPAVLVLAMVEKKGLLSRIWRAIVGEPNIEDEDDWVEEEEQVHMLPETSSKPTTTDVATQ